MSGIRGTMGVILACLTLIAVSGCLESASPFSYRVKYLGEDHGKPAIELEEAEVEQDVPWLADAFEAAKEQGPNGTATVDGGRDNANSAEVRDFIVREREEWACNVSWHFNWTGSTFLVTERVR